MRILLDSRLTLMHSERPKLHRVLAVLSATGLNKLHSRDYESAIHYNELVSRNNELVFTLLHSERPKLHRVLAVLSATG